MSGKNDCARSLVEHANPAYVAFMKKYFPEVGNILTDLVLVSFEGSEFEEYLFKAIEDKIVDGLVECESLVAPYDENGDYDLRSISSMVEYKEEPSGTLHSRVMRYRSERRYRSGGIMNGVLSRDACRLFYYKGVKILLGDNILPDSEKFNKESTLVVEMKNKQCCIDFINDYYVYLNNNSKFKGSCLYYVRGVHGNLKHKVIERSDTSMSDLVLSKMVHKQIETYVLGFLHKIKRYQELGVTSSAGVFLTGPPGNGKTTFCKALCDQYPDYTFFWVLSQAVNESRDIYKVYQDARKFSPSIVLWEDAGPYVRNRENGDVARGSESILDEFLQQLCGPFDNSGVFTIMTSNLNVEEIDGAILRPGRIGYTIEFPKPNRSLVAKYIKKIVASLSSNKNTNIHDIVDDIISEVVKHHDKHNYSFAQLNEIFDNAKRYAVDGDSVDGDQIIVRQKDIESAIDVMSKIGDRYIEEKVGFRKVRYDEDYDDE